MNCRLSLRLRLRLLACTVRSSVAWGLESLCPTKLLCNRLDNIHRHMMHLVAGSQVPRIPDEEPYQFWRRARHHAVETCRRYKPAFWSSRWIQRSTQFLRAHRAVQSL
eukprot:4408719-Amphidinium_carterae.1